MNDDAIKARLAAATPGPWFARPNDLIGGWCVRIVDTLPSEGPGEVADFIREEDARFIAHALQDIEVLLAEVEYLRGERDAVVTWLQELSASSLNRDPVEELLYAARSIERGDHRREEE